VNATAEEPNTLRHALVYDAAAVDRMGKALREGFVLGVVPPDRRQRCAPKGEALDALGREIDIKVVAGDAPELFAVGLEEEFEKAATERGHDPVFEVRRGASDTESRSFS